MPIPYRHGIVGYTDEYRAKRLAQTEAQNREDAERQASYDQQNAQARAERKRKEAEQAAELQAARDEQTDAIIRPLMAAAARQWKIDHPSDDFEKVRYYVRQQITEQEIEKARSAEKARMLQSGRYSDI